MATMYCTYCASTDLSVYKTTATKTYYKCNECKRIVVNPIIINIDTVTDNAETTTATA